MKNYKIETIHEDDIESVVRPEDVNSLDKCNEAIDLLEKTIKVLRNMNIPVGKAKQNIEMWKKRRDELSKN